MDEPRPVEIIVIILKQPLSVLAIAEVDAVIKQLQVLFLVAAFTLDKVGFIHSLCRVPTLNGLNHCMWEGCRRKGCGQARCVCVVEGRRFRQ